MDINRVILIGRTTRDIELKYTPSGAAVCSFTLANGRKVKDVEQTSFIDCVAWQKTAEIIAQYVTKGNRIAVEGRLQQRSWTDGDGNKKSKVEVVVENFQFLESKQAGASAHTPGILEGEIVKDADIDNPFDDSDLPF
jgi:single-strand DNA-binding protein